MIITKLNKNIMVKAISLFLILTFSMYNVGFAIIEENVGPPEINDIVAPLQVADIGIAIDTGNIKSRFSGSTEKVIVHIQDAHCNYEAQTNINKILDQLTRECGMNMISVEGAEGVVDTAWFRAFPDAEIRREVADYFMKKGEVTGAEFFSIVSDYNGTIFGAETREYYIKNLKAFTDVYPHKSSVENYFVKMRTVANRLKSIVYHPPLKRLDKKIRAFASKDLELSDYAEYLSKTAVKKGVDIKDCGDFNKLLQTLEYEDKIDFDIVDKERSDYIDALGDKLSKEDMTELVGKSVMFKKGHIKAVEFYTFLRDLAKDNDVDMVNEYKNLFYYYIYTKLYDGIDNENLFREIDIVKTRLKEKLFKDDTQRKLDKYATMLDMFIDLVNIELTNEDYERYTAYSEEFSMEDVLGFLGGLTNKYNLNYTIDTLPIQIKENIPRMVDFYEIAMKRDKALIDNTLRRMEEEGKDRSVLIAGGFHTKGMKRLLEKQGVSYVVVTPKITKDVETPYIKVLTNQRTSLEDIITDSAAMPGTMAPTKEGKLAAALRLNLVSLYLRNDPALAELSQEMQTIKNIAGSTSFEEIASGTYNEAASMFVQKWIAKMKELAGGEDSALWAALKAEKNSSGEDRPFASLVGAFFMLYDKQLAEEGLQKVELNSKALEAIADEFATHLGYVKPMRLDYPHKILTTPEKDAWLDAVKGLLARDKQNMTQIVLTQHVTPVNLSESGLDIAFAGKNVDADVRAQLTGVKVNVYHSQDIKAVIAEINANAGKKVIPEDLVALPFEDDEGNLYIGIDDSDWNVLSNSQTYRFVAHEAYHYKRPDLGETEVVKALDDDLRDVRERIALERQAADIANAPQTDEVYELILDVGEELAGVTGAHEYEVSVVHKQDETGNIETYDRLKIAGERRIEIPEIIADMLATRQTSEDPKMVKPLNLLVSGANGAVKIYKNGLELTGAALDDELFAEEGAKYEIHNLAKEPLDVEFKHAGDDEKQSDITLQVFDTNKKVLAEKKYLYITMEGMYVTGDANQPGTIGYRENIINENLGVQDAFKSTTFKLNRAGAPGETDIEYVKAEIDKKVEDVSDERILLLQLTKGLFEGLGSDYIEGLLRKGVNIVPTVQDNVIDLAEQGYMPAPEMESLAIMQGRLEEKDFEGDRSSLARGYKQVLSVYTQTTVTWDSLQQFASPTAMLEAISNLGPVWFSNFINNFLLKIMPFASEALQQDLSNRKKVAWSA